MRCIYDFCSLTNILLLVNDAEWITPVQYSTNFLTAKIFDNFQTIVLRNQNFT